MSAHRSVRPLVGSWATALGILALLWWLVTRQPAYRGLVRPLAPLLFIAPLVATWRWLRHRSRHERRGGDRRKHERRDGE